MISPRKVGRQLATIAAAGRAFATSATFRGQLAALLGSDRATQRITETERQSVDDDARAYADLTVASLALVAPSIASAPPHLNLVVPQLRVGAVFAGVSTALEVAADLARLLSRPLRVVVLSPNDHDTGDVVGLIRERVALDADVITRRDLASSTFGEDDLWIATHWTTAHALQIACGLKRIDPARVIYLIQDYEAGFTPWSTDFALARATYHAGFRPIVNSTPLAAHLRRWEGLDIPASRVFGPAFDLDLLRRTQERRARRDRIRILFYGRPSKPRNLFPLGVAALSVAIRELGQLASKVEVISAGEQHPNLDLGHGVTLTSRGTLPWDAYFELLASADVVLSLQYSPHPSHPPFDAAISGALAVTNEFDDTRANLHPRLFAAEPTADGLGIALAHAVRLAHEDGPGGFEQLPKHHLGGPLGPVLRGLAQELA